MSIKTGKNTYKNRNYRKIVKRNSCNNNNIIFLTCSYISYICLYLLYDNNEDCHSITCIAPLKSGLYREQQGWRAAPRPQTVQTGATQLTAAMSHTKPLTSLPL